MLEELRIRDLGVISDAVLEPSPALTVVTGETGAGKTMVLTGLALLLGGRTDPALVRPGAERASVEGRFRMPEGGAAERATEAGAELDEDGSLVVSRTVGGRSAGGRARAYLGGRGVPAALLAEVGAEAVAVHGQHDQQRLLRPGAQLALLDGYAGSAVTEPLATYQTAYRGWREVVARLAERRRSAGERAERAEMLSVGLGEVDRLNPQPGEDVTLTEESRRLAHAEGLREAAGIALGALTGEVSDFVGQAPAFGFEGAPGGGMDPSDVQQLLSRARRALGSQTAHDPELSALAERLDEVAALVGEVAADLGSYLAGLAADPERLAEVQERRSALNRLIRRYGSGSSADALLDWAAEARQLLLELDGSAEAIAGLEAERDRLASEVEALAERITVARTLAAERLAVAVTAELAGLAMPHARLEVGLRASALGPDGGDDVEFLLVPHRSSPARPLGRGASGGELSRVMLALEVVLAGTSGAPTLVFDEVDAGVGGAAAVEVGRRLARLAAHHQVLVVTHLAQVAAFADRHVVVGRTSTGEVTTSVVREVSGSERVTELARMLSGLADSETGRRHAEELLALAERGPSGLPEPRGPLGSGGRGARGRSRATS